MPPRRKCKVKLVRALIDKFKAETSKAPSPLPPPMLTHETNITLEEAEARALQKNWKLLVEALKGHNYLEAIRNLKRGSELSTFSGARLMAALYFAYLIVRKLSRLLRQANLSVNGSEVSWSFRHGFELLNAIRSFLTMRFFCVDYCKMEGCNCCDNDMLTGSSPLLDHSSLFYVVVNSGLRVHDIRKPKWGELDGPNTPHDAYWTQTLGAWSALTSKLRAIQLLLLCTFTRSGPLVVLFAKSDLSAEGFSAEVAHSGLNWKAGLVKDYKLSTASLDPGQRQQWIFRGTEEIQPAALEGCRSLEELGLVFSQISGVGNFLAQHLVWNFLELNRAKRLFDCSVDLGVEVASFQRIAKQISLQNTTKLAGRFIEAAGGSSENNMNPEGGPTAAKKNASRSGYGFVDMLGPTVRDSSTKLDALESCFRIVTASAKLFCKMQITAVVMKRNFTFTFAREQEALNLHNYLCNCCMIEKVVSACVD